MSIEQAPKHHKRQLLKRFEGGADLLVVALIVILGLVMVVGLVTANGHVTWLNAIT